MNESMSTIILYVNTILTFPTKVYAHRVAKTLTISTSTLSEEEKKERSM